MELTRQRGAISLTLDRPRVLFFDMQATWLLVERYGLGFARELYTVEQQDEQSVALRLRDPQVLATFVWAGLQRDAADHGETLSVEDATGMLGAWNLPQTFNAVMRAISGAWENPPNPGKDGAAAPPPKAAAKKTARKTASASTRRSASRTGRSAGR